MTNNIENQTQMTIRCEATAKTIWAVATSMSTVWRRWLRQCVHRLATVVTSVCPPSGDGGYGNHFKLAEKATMSQSSSTVSPGMTLARTSLGYDLLGLAGWLIVCFLPAMLAVSAGPDEWYREIAKPSWNPPNWIFGPVWTTLYTMMAFAAWLVWRRGGFAAHGRALTIFLVQLALNAAWSPLFFGLHQPGWAFVEIVAMWLAILATIVAFWKINRWSAVLLVPYLAWVSFASVLNFTLWQMNR